MKNIIQEFKKFAIRGNVVDMAVGVIIGGAFGKIVSSIVNDLIMPTIGVIIGGVNWGLIGLFGFDAVAWLLGGSASLLSRTVYTLVGAAALCAIPSLFGDVTRPQEA